jgi:Domain of unknown function (DUF4062)
MTYKAFISSTFEDLREHRKEVIASLRKASIVVDPMEEWTAASDEPKNFAQDRVQDCQLCVLLVGFRRGHIPKGENLSITQLEYKAANEAGIDVLPFLLREDSPWPRKFDELDKDPGIRRFRAELQESRGVGFFGLAPTSIEVLPAVTRWILEKQKSLDVADKVPRPSPVSGAGRLMVTVFDGSRKIMSPGKKLLFRIIDGNQRTIFSQSGEQPSLYFRDLPAYDAVGDRYTVLVSADGYYQTGFSPAKIKSDAEVYVDLMLLPKKSRLDFSDAAWNTLQQTRPRLFNLIAAGAAPTAGKARYEEFMAQKPESLASFFNVASAMEQIYLGGKTALDYFKEVLWKDWPTQNRFFGYVDESLIGELGRAASEGAFVKVPSFFHPGGTSSFQQVQFGEAKVQLTLHEGSTKKINGVSCVKVESDINYYCDTAAHSILEINPGLSGGQPDPAVVYVLRWAASRRAGVPEFHPPYSIVEDSGDRPSEKATTVSKRRRKPARARSG